MGHQHAVLTMHRHKEFRPGEGQHQFVVFLAAMAGHVDALALAIDHLGSQHHQPVNRVDHRDGVARDWAGRKDDRIAAFYLNLGMIGA